MATASGPHIVDVDAALALVSWNGRPGEALGRGGNAVR